MKKVIINADDFGASIENNKATELGFKSGIITSASIMTNMPGFNNAINETLPSISNIDLGFHFNIIEGKSLTNPNLLCNANGYFNCSFQELMFKSLNRNCLLQIEAEFRSQIEKIINIHKITHIDSHVHIHAIPAIFQLVLKLAQEYDIKFVRTQKEIPYITKNKLLNINLPINIIKNILLNYLSFQNIQKISSSIIKTNDYFIGVMYTGNMSEETILAGLKKVQTENSITEIIFHPYYDKNEKGKKYNNYKEFLITQNQNFKEELQSFGFELSSYLDFI